MTRRNDARLTALPTCRRLPSTNTISIVSAARGEVTADDGVEARRGRFGHTNSHEARRRCRNKLALTHLTPPGMQQAGINVMPCRHFAHAGARLVTLGDDAQLLVQTPAPPPFSAVNDLNLGARHDFKVDLTVNFKVYSSPCPAKSKQGRR